MQKACSLCKAIKPFGEFYKNSAPRSKHGLQSRCKECSKKVASEYARANPEWKRARDKRYAERNPDKVRDRSARRREENPEYWREYAKNYRAKWRAKNPEQESATQKRYRERNPAVVAERMAQYVHAKRRPLAWAERDKMRVVYAKAKEWNMEVDHIVPLRGKLVSGLHVWSNLQLLARPENRRKKNVHWPDMP